MVGRDERELFFATPPPLKKIGCSSLRIWPNISGQDMTRPEDVVEQGLWFRTFSPRRRSFGSFRTKDLLIIWRQLLRSGNPSRKCCQPVMRKSSINQPFLLSWSFPSVHTKLHTILYFPYGPSVAP
ncbi:hypothetical protein CEXT_542661 [Caerostris extrusa]|uniref:Uncharacterized protein n=1 Tax=Caerostris extrusa TaxID=172846 RepID=A0AAV4PNN9_CAEEX|nr:hypothetical protein CEXT_542661 [Caerostris extrusa]